MKTRKAKTFSAQPESRPGTLNHICFGTCGRGRPYTAQIIFKGCLLHCPWCNRPEALTRDLRVMVESRLCIGKDACGITACVGKRGLRVLRGRALKDLPEPEIVAKCPTGALRPDGYETTVPAVVQEVLGQPEFAMRKRRQVVLSGGEPMQQFLFLKELLVAFQLHGVRCVLDTAALASWRQMEMLLPLVDRFLVDLKLIDYRRHQQLCGEENFPVLENIRRLCHRQADLALVLALIPAYTDTRLNLKDIGDFIKTLEPRPPLILLPHDSDGGAAHDQLGIAYPMAEQTLPAARIGQVERYFGRRGIQVSVGQPIRRLSRT